MRSFFFRFRLTQNAQRYYQQWRRVKARQAIAILGISPLEHEARELIKLGYHRSAVCVGKALLEAEIVRLGRFVPYSSNLTPLQIVNALRAQKLITGQQSQCIHAAMPSALAIARGTKRSPAKCVRTFQLLRSSYAFLRGLDVALSAPEESPAPAAKTIVGFRSDQLAGFSLVNTVAEGGAV